ncbi:family 78 glycoside hydrolase catalytic domain [Aeromicrobium sp. CFBP 8757]|uniref:family 78 glycoside hydrolase catalytic domain n=1 Tax=Aeromicrobium sp. CFBP 8757 TaxID=2775288 RepID=UPI001780BCD3|nr:family 78 glycoside hydrolase catalytic domain [Aeromicrobium sp. CFBP 8757]MBD8608775.1 family 78 glycoside hydrolase catalytic domain [Aeromicrobium sp. CFBP 8757]
MTRPRTPATRRLLAIVTASALALVVLASPGTAASAPSAPSAPTSLSVNGIAAPVDVEGTPQLGWHVNAGRQTAYEIEVSSTRGRSADHDGDVWKSGTVTSSTQTGIAYDGPPLAPSGRYFWSVRTWDAKGTASDWSSVATFGTGPGSDWTDSSPIWAPTAFTNWTDYTVDTDFTVVQNAASLTFRTTSASSFYLWQVRADTNSLRTHTGTTLIDDTPLADKGLTIKAGETHHLRVEVRGTTIRTWIDDVLVRTAPNHTSFPSGGFGFRTGSTEQATFDNLVVKDGDGETLYANDFSAPAPELPTLAVTDGRLVVGASKNDFVPGSWSNYTIRTKVQVSDVATGISFRASDGSNSYMWQLRAADNQLKPHRQVNGTYAALKTVTLPAGTLAVGKTVSVRIEAVGTTIKTWIDDVLVDTTTDTTFRRGAVGFRNGLTEAGTFSDYTVTDANPLGGTLLEPTFTAADRTFACGTVGGGTITVGKGEVCLLNGLTANWAFLRSDIALKDEDIAWATLYATGSNPKTAKQYVYKAYVNGTFVGLGPTQPVASEARYDGFDVTDRLERGTTNTLGALAYTTNDQKFQAQLVVQYADGTRDTFGTGKDWTARTGDDVYPAAGSIGTSYFVAPKENLDARAYPTGYDRPGFDDSSWKPAVVKSSIGTLVATPTDKVEQQLHDPVRIVDKGNGTYFVDFGRTWIGGVRYRVDSGKAGSKVDLRFGEVPSGTDTVKYQLNTGNTYQDVVTLRDGRQTLDTWGMRVFRYVEIVGAPEPVTAENLQALALVYPFDREASTFSASNDNLEQVYQLSKNSIESLNVNFYTDSWTRERTNYEADAYLQQLSTLYVMDDLSLGRYSMNYFKGNRTWPTEWPIYVVLAVHDAWRQTGDTGQLADYYENLQAKLPTKWLEASTGLIRKTTGVSCSSQTDCDIVDWPTSERDGFQFRQYNTVVNAISYRAYRDMAAIAAAIGKDSDAAEYTAIADRLRTAINVKLYDAEGGRYDDGMDASQTRSGHYSVHASAFALAFGVPEEKDSADVASFIKSRGMACSVYCAAFLVKALYDGGDGQTALDLMTATGTRSWMNMIELGAGSTAEAWDPSLKSNLTYSHPWAASPAFNVPSGLFGIQPLTPGYETFRVLPQPGDLAKASITVPTVKGTIGTSFDHDAQGRMELAVSVPGNTTATVHVPLPEGADDTFVPAHAQQVTYEGRTNLPGGTFATFTAPAGSWTFGPGEQPATPTGTVSGELTGTSTADWYGAGTRLVLTATAPDGAVTEYRTDAGAWTTYTAPVDLADGDVAVEYRVRLDDDVLDSGRLTARVDGTAPTVTHAVSGRTVSISATDAGSGVASVEQRVDDGEWGPYTSPVAVDDASHTVRYRATDVAGNVAREGVVNLEGRAPVATAGPSISGSAVVGRVLTASAPSWDVDGVATTLRWTRNGVPIDGATGGTYRVGAADAGTRLEVVATGNAAGRATGSATSGPTRRVERATSRVSRSLSRTTVRSGGRTTLRVLVRASGVTPYGRVDVYYRGKRVRSGVKLVDGRLSTSFRPQVRGRHTLTIAYRGSSGVRPDRASVSLRVR